MGLFSSSKKKARTVALIDIGSASVGGAFMHHKEGEQPVIYYTARVDIEPRADETITESMLRSLSFLERLLIEEGAPTLRRETGNAAIAETLVSIAAPWQESKVSTTLIEEERPFVFTRERLDKEDTQEIPKDRISTGKSLISTTLNGYEVSKPFGKHATRVEAIVLSSTIDRAASEQVRASLRKAFHAHTIEITAFAPVAYRVFKDLYPLQKDFIVIDVSGSGTDILLVKHGHLVEVGSLASGTHDLIAAARNAGQHSQLGNPELIDSTANATFAAETESVKKAWVEGLRGVLAGFAADHALPHAVFLLADQGSRAYLERLMEESDLKTLWLAESSLSVVSLAPSHLSSRLKTRGLGEGDLFLAILALYVACDDGMTIPAPVIPA